MKLNSVKKTIHFDKKKIDNSNIEKKIKLESTVSKNMDYFEKESATKKENFNYDQSTEKKESVSVEALKNRNSRFFGDLYLYDVFDAKHTVFDDWNTKSEQYGGNQRVFREKNQILLKDPAIRRIIKNYYPKATLEDMEAILFSLCNVGCGYTAVINTIFAQYAGREEEFQRTFGFPMYQQDRDGKVDFNYEYLILIYFVIVIKNIKI